MQAELDPPRVRTRRRLATRVVALAVAGLLIALLAYGLASKAPNTSIDQSLAKAKPIRAPGFELPVLQRGQLGPKLAAALRPALADGRVAVGELRGTPVVVNFWASWCVPCRAEAPLLERGWLGARSRAVLLLGINMQDLTSDARDFMRRFHNTYLNVRDRTDATARRYGATGLPETFFVDRRGDVVGHVIGAISPVQLQAGIDAAFSGRVRRPQTGGEQLPTR